MRTTRLIIVLPFCLFLLSPVTSVAQNLLRGPQKIVVDAARNRLLVSNYDGGALVEIDSAGHQSYFVQNAGFVDGCEIVGDTIYGVGNNRRVLAYDLVSKRQIMNITLTGNAANYLSSVAYDSAGHIFISCPSTNEIYKLRLSDRKWWVFVKDNGLNKPNGVLLEKEKNRIVVIDDSPSPALIHAISLADTSVTTIRSTTFTQPDGITRDKYGYHYMGGYYLTGLYMTDAGFSYAPTKFFSGASMVYPTYDPATHSLLVTHYNDNTWERVPLTTTASIEISTAREPLLYSVYPNPFASDLTLRFELKTNSSVRIEAFNSAGMRVSVLVDEEKGPGIQSVTWNGTDDSGRKAAKGVYLFRLSMDGAVQVQEAIKLE
ncbi:MAG: FlgD immunoglobulin-like domain containing protein [Bacteroidota bacterium]